MTEKVRVLGCGEELPYRDMRAPVTDSGVVLADKLKKFARIQCAFHVFFLGAVSLECLSLVLYFSFWMHSPAVALLLATIFLTVFTYLVLRCYRQAKKPQQFADIVSETIRQLSSPSLGPGSLDITKDILYTVEYIYHIECDFYILPVRLVTFNVLLRKMSIYCHWKDLLRIKALLLLEAVERCVSVIKEDADDIEAHALLAECYLRFATIYQDPSHTHPEQYPWVAAEYGSVEMEQKHKSACLRALEELQIIDSLTPGDLWVHAQLASTYRRLRLFAEEIREYEQMLDIHPGEHDLLYRLGVLYFQQGMSAKGLLMYDRLKKASNPKAAALLEYYGATSAQQLLI